VLVDPRGYVVAQVSGEGHGPSLSSLVDELVAGHGTPYAAGRSSPAHDSGHHRLVELEPDLVGVRRIIGAGRGLRDGAAATALFADPLGLAVLPAAVATTVGYDVVVADSANHVLRGVRLHGGAVSTVAGTRGAAARAARRRHGRPGARHSSVDPVGRGVVGGAGGRGDGRMPSAVIVRPAPQHGRGECGDRGRGSP
jgi:hypothetical protein